MSEAATPKPDRKTERKQRLAAALRANLRRRKAQARARQPDDEAARAESDKDPPSDQF